MGRGRAFILGAEPGLPGALCLAWFIRGRYAGGPAFLGQFPHLVAWEARVRALGHGQPREMAALDALAIAHALAPETPAQADRGDPEGWVPGVRVAIVPDDVGGGPPVVGEIVSVSAEAIALRRRDDRVGDVVVHFPRVGYRVSPSQVA